MTAPDEDETIIVAPAAEPGASERDADETVVVTRPDTEATVVGAPSGVPADDSDESTVVVSRSSDLPEEDQSTVVVSARNARSTEDESTVVRPSSTGSNEGGESEKTVVVDRPRKRALEKETPRRRRGQLRPAPVPVEVLDRAVPAPGPGAIDTYAAREIQEPPLLGTVDTGVRSERPDPATIPSVGRRSQRTAVIVAGSLAVAVVVAIAGLTAIGFALLG